MHYYLYRITNKVNNKIYVGVHKTKSLDDGYMGSGKVIRAAILKHGAENFQKEILETFDDAASMYEREKQFVDEAFLNRDDTYNLRRGGYGGFDFINQHVQTAESRAAYGKIGQSVSPWYKHNNLRTYVFTETDRRKSTGFSGMRHSAETIQQMSISRKQRGCGESNSQFGSFWITNEISNAKCKGSIPPGWRKGRVTNKG